MSHIFFALCSLSNNAQCILLLAAGSPISRHHRSGGTTSHPEAQPAIKDWIGLMIERGRGGDDDGSVNGDKRLASAGGREREW